MLGAAQIGLLSALGLIRLLVTFALFAIALGVLSMLLLVIFVNPITALLTFASLIGYAIIYTGWLKRATPQNIVIGGIAGAAPPLLGWAAVTGMQGAWDWAHALLLVLIIFVWTPPHFWALAIFRREDYARALVPMLPVTHGVHYTRWQILFYTLLLGYAAFTLTIMAVLLAVARRHWDPLLRLAAIAVISGLIMLITWAPYLLAAARGTPAESGTAQHYLPKDGAELSFPMLDFTLLGALCMLGTIWLIVRARSSTRRIFPEMVLGSSANSSRRMRLYGARLTRQWCRMLSAVSAVGS